MTFDPNVQALLDAAREGLAPDPATIARMRSGVAATTGAAGTVVATKASLGIVKVMIVAAVAGTASISVGLAVRASPSAREPAHSAPAAPAPAPAPVPVPDRLPDPPPPVVAPALAEPTPAPTAPPPRAQPTKPPTLAREISLLDAARTALRTGLGDPLAALAAYERETGGHGQLEDEAKALSTEANGGRQ